MNQPVPQVAQTTHVVQPSAANPTTAAAAVSSNTNQSQLSSNTTVSSMADLKRKAPQVYQKMMEGIAMDICNQMQHHQERLKEMMDEARRNA